MVTFVFAGGETSAIMIAWTWYLLGLHPDAENRLKTELNEVLGGRTPNFNDLFELKYTRRLLEESMRLYPPVWSLFRRAANDDMLGAYRVTANASVVVSPYAMHRNPRYWPDPDRFDPERALPPRCQRVAHGIRICRLSKHLCLGNHFAMMKGQLIVATVARRYAVRAGHPVEPLPLTTLRQRTFLATAEPC